jgi:hypothetical protein
MPQHALPDLHDIPRDSVNLYNLHRSEALLHINDFLLKYLNSLYTEFKGDIVLAVVLGELAHQNLAPMLAQLKKTPGTMTMPTSIEELQGGFLPTNPLSISEATGIPRETVRRKFSILHKLGWIERISHTGYVITGKVSEHFVCGFNLQLFEGVLHLYEQLRMTFARQMI